jgi:FkbM family methyltransferase
MKSAAVGMRFRRFVEKILPPSWLERLRGLLGADGESPRTMRHLGRMRDQGFDPRVVIDAGAAHGDWTVSCRRIFPRAVHVMIEPLPLYASELSALAEDDRIEYMPVAAGRQKMDLPLLVPERPGGSSFLPSSRPEDTYFKRAVMVPVVPLDGLDIPEGPTLLKLDVQGFEFEVIAGAGHLLEQVDVIVVECSLHPFQRDLPLIDEVIERVSALGFRLYDTADEERWVSGTLAQVDVIFVRSDSPLLASQWWR